MRSDSQGLSLGEHPGGCVNTHHWAPCALFPSGRGQVPGDGEGSSCEDLSGPGILRACSSFPTKGIQPCPAHPRALLPHFAISSRHLVHAQGGKAISAVPITG